MRQHFAAGDFPRAKELGKVLQSIAKKFGNTTVVNSLQDQMQGSSGNLVADIGHHLQLAAIEQDS